MPRFKFRAIWNSRGTGGRFSARNTGVEIRFIARQTFRGKYWLVRDLDIRGAFTKDRRDHIRPDPRASKQRAETLDILLY